jgi:hypothetical protein
LRRAGWPCSSVRRICRETTTMRLDHRHLFTALALAAFVLCALGSTAP